MKRTLVLIFSVIALTSISCQKEDDSLTDIIQTDSQDNSTELVSVIENDIKGDGITAEPLYFELQGCWTEGENGEQCFGAECAIGFWTECDANVYSCTCLTPASIEDENWTGFDYELAAALGYDTPQEVYSNWDNFRDMIEGNEQAINLILDRLNEMNS